MYRAADRTPVSNPPADHGAGRVQRPLGERRWAVGTARRSGRRWPNLLAIIGAAVFVGCVGGTPAAAWAAPVGPYVGEWPSVREPWRLGDSASLAPRWVLANADEGAEPASEEFVEPGTRFALTLWLVAGLEAGSPSFDSAGFADIGMEFGLPWRTVDPDVRLLPMATMTVGFGYRGYRIDDVLHDAGVTAVTVLLGVGMPYDAGTFVVGPLLRWDYALRPLRDPDGVPLLGANGRSGLALGGYARFILFTERFPIPIPIGVYVTADLEPRARRDITLMFDLGAMALLGAIASAIFDR